MKLVSLIVTGAMSAALLSGCTQASASGPVVSTPVAQASSAQPTVVATATTETTPPSVAPTSTPTSTPTPRVSKAPQAPKARSCSETTLKLNVGDCMVDDEDGTVLSRQDTLNVCLAVRDDFVISTTELSNAAQRKLFLRTQVCSNSVSLYASVDQIWPMIQGLPDRDALPDGWPSDWDVEDWFDGRFYVEGINTQTGKPVRQAYDKFGHLISLKETDKLIERYNVLRWPQDETVG